MGNSGQTPQSGGTELLTVKNLNVFYGGIQALYDVSLHINSGEILSINDLWRLQMK